MRPGERILYHLAGTRWDDDPLPYPKLCQLYRGCEATASDTPAPRGHVELVDAMVSGRKDRPWLKPDQYTVTHRWTDPYLYVTLDPPPRDGIKTLAHLAGALSLETDEYGPRRVRFSYEVLCRLAGRQWRARGDQLEKAAEAHDPAEVSEAPRLCACGGPSSPGRPANASAPPAVASKHLALTPRELPKTRGSKSVTATNTATGGVSHRITAARRADGSLRDSFSDLPTPALLARMSTEAIEHNKRTQLTYGPAYRA